MRPLASLASLFAQTEHKAPRALLPGSLAALFRVLLLALPLTLAMFSAHAEDAEFSQGELDQMLAPVALYPDTVLSHILIAATYPLEVVQASRWSRDNPGLKGAEAVAAVEDMDWDPSIKALVAFPNILQRMNDDLEWTQRLGDALLAQEEQVLDSVQGLRQRAHEAGSLDTMEHVEVVREAQTIVIEPAVREVVYVPYYDTRIVYGHWWWPAYPPVYWYSPSSFYSASGFYWGPGVRISPWFYFSSFHWHQRHVVVVHHHHYHRRHHYYSSRDISRHHNARHWQHNPKHRRGVAYRDWPQRNTSQKHAQQRGDGQASWQGSGQRHPDTGRRLPAVERNTQRSGEQLQQRLSENNGRAVAPRADQRGENRRSQENRNMALPSGELRQRLSEPRRESNAQRPRPNNVQPQQRIRTEDAARNRDNAVAQERRSRQQALINQRSRAQSPAQTAPQNNSGNRLPNSRRNLDTEARRDASNVLRRNDAANRSNHQQTGRSTNRQPAAQPRNVQRGGQAAGNSVQRNLSNNNRSVPGNVGAAQRQDRGGIEARAGRLRENRR